MMSDKINAKAALDALSSATFGNGGGGGGDGDKDKNGKT